MGLNAEHLIRLLRDYANKSSAHDHHGSSEPSASKKASISRVADSMILSMATALCSML
jgi:hypothetical protein